MNDNTVMINSAAPNSGPAGEIDGGLVSLTVDIVAVVRHPERPTGVLLIERGCPPHMGRLALPGGFVDTGEDLRDAAIRELGEETGLHLSASDLTQVGAYGAPGRDPRGRVVTVAYLALLPDMPRVVGGDDARAAHWVVPLDEVLADPHRLAFDHHKILSDAVALLPAAAGVTRWVDVAPCPYGRRTVPLYGGRAALVSEGEIMTNLAMVDGTPAVVSADDAADSRWTPPPM